MLFLLSSPSRLSFVSVVFDFNASLNNVAPVSLILLTVDFMRVEKSGLLMDAIFVLSILNLQLRLSSMSVAFDFNASLSDVAPVSPMPLPVCLILIKQSGLLMDAICVVSFVFTFQIELSECCV